MVQFYKAITFYSYIATKSQKFANKHDIFLTDLLKCANIELKQRRCMESLLRGSFYRSRCTSDSTLLYGDVFFGIHLSAFVLPRFT